MNVLGALAAVVAAVLLSGYVLMLGIGVAFHQDLLASTADYPSSVVLAIVIAFVTGGASASASAR